MKAAVIDRKDRLSIKTVEMPVLNEEEALIKVKYCGICGSDIHILKGEHPTAKFPVTPGHEFVGELVEIKGTLAGKFQPGDMVVAQPYVSCGNCGPCAKGRDNICEDLRFMGAHINGGFAEYVKVLARKMYKIPKELDLELAALAEPVAVAVHDVRNSGLAVGETALVIGGGPIGMLIAIVAENAGAGQVVITEIVEERRAFAKELGYTALNPLDADFESRLAALTEKKGFDTVFEVSGSKPGIGAAIKHAKIAGTVMVIGMTSEPHPVNLSDVFAKELNIQGARIHNQYNFKGAVNLLAQGCCNEKFRKLISKVYNFDDIVSAFDFAKVPGNYFKVLVKM